MLQTWLLIRTRVFHKLTGELGQSSKCLKLLAAIDFRAVERVMHDFDCLVVGAPVDRIRRSILSSMRERIARRISVAGAGAVDQLRGERERAQSLRADSFDSQQRLEIGRGLLVGSQQDFFSGISDRCRSLPLGGAEAYRVAAGAATRRGSLQVSPRRVSRKRIAFLRFPSRRGSRWER